MSLRLRMPWKLLKDGGGCCWKPSCKAAKVFGLRFSLVLLALFITIMVVECIFSLTFVSVLAFLPLCRLRYQLSPECTVLA